MLRKRLITLLALVMVLAACGSDTTTTTTGAASCGTDSAALHEPGKLTVATGEPAFPPWVLDDAPESGEGFEAAVVYALAEELGFAQADVQWVRTTFDEAIAVGEKPYDFNLQQYSIRPERAEVVDFSIPYYSPQKVLVALSGSAAASAASLEDLKGIKFGATIGTTDLDYIEQVIEPDQEVNVYNTQGDALEALQGGSIEATVVALPSAFYITAVQVEGSEIVGVLPRAGEEDEGLGLLFEKGNTYRPCVDTALQSLHDEGTIQSLVERWLQGDGDIPEIAE